MDRRRIAIVCAVSLLTGACSLVLGIDGDVVDRDPPAFEGGGEQEQQDAAPPVLVVEELPPLSQGGETALHVARPAGTTGRIATVTLAKEALPFGVTTDTLTLSIKEGETGTIKFVAAPNATLGSVDLTLTGDIGNIVLPVHLVVAGNLDTTFGDHGITTVPFDVTPDELNNFGLTVDAVSGRIYVAYTRFDVANDINRAAVARCLPDGGVDTTFGSKGFVDVNSDVDDGGVGVSEGRAVVVNADGSIVVFGDGRTPDEFEAPVPFTFSPPSTKVRNFALTPNSTAAEATTVNVAAAPGDGGIIALGTREKIGATARPPFLFHTDRNGLQDPSFGGATPYLLIPGMLDGEDLAVADGGKMLVFGSADLPGEDTDTMVVRLLADGGPDPTFGVGGVVRTNSPVSNTTYAGAIEAAGSVLFVGEIGAATANGRMQFGRVDDRGVFDPTFGDGGTVAVGGPDPLRPGATARAVVPLADGKFLVTGGLEDIGNPATLQRVFVARFMHGGALDTTFGWKGFSLLELPNTEGRRMAWQNDKVIVGTLIMTKTGSVNVVLMRYKP